MIVHSRRLLAEFLGTALLTAVVIGSGIAAGQLSPGAAGLELLENALVTALGLFVIILLFAPISGAHLNPLITLVDVVLGRRGWAAITYVPAQFAGCFAGALLANVMFGRAAIEISSRDRLTAPHLIGEVVATAGLVLVVFVLARTGRDRFAPAAVGAYIGAAYFFTSSASFANPAITVARMFSDTFAGIAPLSVPGFIVAQVVGAAAGLLLVALLTPTASIPRQASLEARS